MMGRISHNFGNPSLVNVSCISYERRPMVRFKWSMSWRLAMAIILAIYI